MSACEEIYDGTPDNGSLQSSVDRPSDVGTRCSTAGFYWTRQSDVQGDTEIRPTYHLVGVLVGCYLNNCCQRPSRNNP